MAVSLIAQMGHSTARQLDVVGRVHEVIVERAQPDSAEPDRSQIGLIDGVVRI